MKFKRLDENGNVTKEFAKQELTLFESHQKFVHGNLNHLNDSRIVRTFEEGNTIVTLTYGGLKEIANKN